MGKFFEDLPFKSKANCEILYPSIKKPTAFNKKKKKQIVFTGKLNSSKGLDLFGQAVIKILGDEFPDWKATIAGNEPREKYNFKHKNLKVYNWLLIKKFLTYTQSRQYLWCHQDGRSLLEGLQWSLQLMAAQL